MSCPALGRRSGEARPIFVVMCWTLMTSQNCRHSSLLIPPANTTVVMRSVASVCLCVTMASPGFGARGAAQTEAQRLRR